MKVYIQDNFCTVYKLQSNYIASYARQKGIFITDSKSDADVFILGLCAAFKADEERSIRLIEDTALFGRKILIYGCFTTVREDLAKSFGKTSYYPLWDIQGMLRELEIDCDDFMPEQSVWPSEFRLKDDYRVYDTRKKFIGISTGYSFGCVYCPHKLGSGDLLSRSHAAIIAQIGRDLDSGDAKVFILTATDTAAYGRDIGSSFAALLENVLAELKKRGSKAKVRIAQFNPEGLVYDREKLLALCCDSRVEELQLPIQTSSDRLLELMGRNYRISIVAYDTIIEDLPDTFYPDRPWGKGNNPKTAVWSFLQENDSFVVDESIDSKLLISSSPRGYLRRVAA